MNSLLVKEDSVTSFLDEMEQESEHRGGPVVEIVEETGRELREVMANESREFKIGSLVIKNMTIFKSDNLNPDLEARSQGEFRDQSFGENKKIDLKEEKCVIHELVCVKGNKYKCETRSEDCTSKEFQQQHICSTPYGCLICKKVMDDELKFETKSLVIKADVTAFISENLNPELDTSYETESRYNSVIEYEDTDLDEEMCDNEECWKGSEYTDETCPEMCDNEECWKGNEYIAETYPEMFTSKELQEQHQCATPYRCLICMKVLNNEANLCTHMLQHKNEPCRLCGKMFSNKTYYLRHLRVHGGLGHRCSYCNKLFPSLTTFTIHVRKHTGEKPYVCETCGKSFARKQNYKCHLRKHTGEKPFQCSTCLKMFSSREGLKAHLLIHTDEKHYVCEICGSSFAGQSQLWHHTKNAHTLKEKKFKCSLCPKEYFENNKLQVHLRRHTGERPYPCQICGKAFITRFCMIKHLNVHTGEKSYGCTFCSKKFSTSSSRDRHVRIHTGEAPYVCATCDKAFLLRRDLIKHVFKFQH